ncbi:MAG TPA: undecaprenyldiphospho-muramoylpentapeptide beta-N-acetylglucosaminyltransferase [Candidatus Thioglobus sp.]|jgi:UDP-N-acetylglucosamine--N-acetylmuramyl-(pentapeptide) pyrophosphoryl-undecaprenol N-acetylglucosamine transferase|nr:undecaprenyldiphospho-muramoylpentapeptide beta-N-acetylglucosaminyltransferase [Candidatus Thioglobus sp.]HIL21586.1 undecaprenyldiphospho-muramoylpentapeptide beta-N-acetylglucosaminyltransferase [Candidatus Thioglobus sp.]
MSDKILIMAGGTGGHIFPALAIAAELKGRGASIAWLGTKQGMENTLVPKHGYQLHRVSSSGVRGKNFVTLIKAFFILILSFFQILLVFIRVRPNQVIGMGGYASGIGGVVARMLFIPLAIHEQNTIPGTTNLILSRLARRTFQAFKGSFKPEVGAITVGNPLSFTAKSKTPPESVKNLLVLGGSLGAKRINETVAKITTPVNIWHQTGKQHLDSTKALYQNHSSVDLKVEAFIESMSEAYAWADVVICRAGAMTVSELIATKSIAILVPFPFAVDDHQTSNAKHLTGAGAGILLQENRLSKKSIDEILQSLDKAKLKAMSDKLETLQQPNPARAIADYLLMPKR